jgi:inosine-uridine nucleoside N-ribohydrolase
MGTWYGYPHVPVGIFKEGDTLQAKGANYTQRVCALTLNGKPAFARTVRDYNSLPSACVLYRKLLSEQPDSSVTVISTGFLSNLALLLDTPADEYSPLTGKELVGVKVKLLSIMAGSFTEKPYQEYNVLMNKPAASKVFAEWASPIVASPYEVGDSIKYPAESIETDFKWVALHPMVEGYKNFSQMPYNRPTWDLTSVLYAVEPDNSFFSLSIQGNIIADEDGYTHFIADKNGKHRYLTTTPGQREAILNHFIKIISGKPKSFND